MLLFFPFSSMLCYFQFQQKHDVHGLLDDVFFVVAANVQGI